MRIRISLLAALSLGVAAAAVTETRAAGAYTSLTVASPAACARACADDGICMAWLYRAANTCELSAVVAPPPADVIAAGFSNRAPAFATRHLTAVSAAPPMSELPNAAEPVPEDAPTREADELSAMLLGGPEEGDLRQRLAAPR